MSKMDQHKLKVQHVLKVFLFLFLIISQTSFSQERIANREDYHLLKTILSNTKKMNKDKQVLFKTTDNNAYTFKVIQKQKLVEDDSNEDDVLKQIFNLKEYDFLLSQKYNSNWDFDKAKVEGILKYEDNSNLKNAEIVTIARPIYTSDKKYALVSINMHTWQGVQVFKYTDGKWTEYKLIAPISIQPKAKLQ